MMVSQVEGYRAAGWDVLSDERFIRCMEGACLKDFFLDCEMRHKNLGGGDDLP